MSLIIASVIGVIILGLLIASGIMYLTKKKEKSNRSNISRARSQHEPPRTHTPTRGKKEKTKTKSSPSQVSSAPMSNISESSIRTEKSSMLSPNIV
ncbi:hypothetical protein CAEBREN_18119 [Caenorhabditis brenneri]|uniref:Uncharacterized protein n=1 Tax=Caenorhabditis brenneri TaxID=135651 RepID=G0N5G8_CAEBE|nr:hypothetical protein CAEBREN_18119 [Caenorhabditis brenneri]